MNIRFLIPALFIFVFSASDFSQTIKITPEKIVYTRKFKVPFKEKKTFSITYPIISGTISPAAKRNLENTISYRRVFDTSLKDNLSNESWLEDASYKVNYNKNGILCLALRQEGSGAYPSSQTVNQVIDLKTGKQVLFKDAFKLNTLPELAELIQPKLDAEKGEIIKGIRQDKIDYSSEDDRKSDEEMVGKLKFTIKDFKEFKVSDRGVTILYDADFPHATQALQPGGDYFFTWKEIKPFIKRGGLLERFIR